MCVRTIVPLESVTTSNVIISTVISRVYNNDCNDVYFCNAINNYFAYHKLKTGTQYPVNPMYRHSLLLVSCAVSFISYVSYYTRISRNCF